MNTSREMPTSEAQVAMVHSHTVGERAVWQAVMIPAIKASATGTSGDFLMLIENQLAGLYLGDIVYSVGRKMMKKFGISATDIRTL